MQTTNQTFGRRFVIKPMSRSAMNAPRSDAGDYAVSMAYSKIGVDALYSICQTLWAHDPRNRNLGFIMSKEGTRVPRVFIIPDFRMEKDEKKKEQALEN